MIKEEGQVVAVEQGAAWIETIRKSTCSSCSARNGCGQHLAEKLRSSKSHSYIKAISDISLKEGDRVIVGIPETALISASVLMYLIPLVIMMSGLWLGNALGFHELLVALLAVIGLAIGYWPVRALNGREADMCRVQVLEVMASNTEMDTLIPVHQT